MKTKLVLFIGTLILSTSLLTVIAQVKKNNAIGKPSEKVVYGFVVENKTQEVSKTGIGCYIEVTVADQASFILSPNFKDTEYKNYKFVETTNQEPVKITWIEKYIFGPDKKEVMCENGFHHIIKEFKPKIFTLGIKEITTGKDKNSNPDLVIFNDGGYKDMNDGKNKEQVADIKPIVEEKDFQGYFTIPNLNDIPKENVDKMLQFAMTAMRDKAREAHLSVVEKIIFDYLVEKFFTGKSWIEKAKPNPKTKK